MSYARFAAMIATATVAMYGLMYLNVFELGHVAFSEMRVYMAIVMGATMAIIMLGYMRTMYSNRSVNVGIFVGCIVVFGIALYLVRSQATIGDTSYMRAMIPHHSIAILTSERANISDPRVRELADQIIETQREEIGQMEFLIGELTNSNSN